MTTTKTGATAVALWDACKPDDPCQHCAAGRPGAPEDAPSPANAVDAWELDDAVRYALPPAYHRPVFDAVGQPNLWLCAVCWEDGLTYQWPCVVAARHGSYVSQAWADEAATR